MGLPTTATYVVIGSLIATVIVDVGGVYGFVVPLMAAHLFCFYFGILADDTPPVGLAAYAAAAIAKSPPIATGVQAFLYDIRTAILPFMFIFNNDLILHNVTRWDHGILIFVTACVGNFAFASATQIPLGGHMETIVPRPVVRKVAVTVKSSPQSQARLCASSAKADQRPSSSPDPRSPTSSSAAR